MSITRDDDSVVALTRAAGPEEIVQVRSHVEREVKPGSDLPLEEQGNISQVEVNYV